MNRLTCALLACLLFAGSAQAEWRRPLPYWARGQAFQRPRYPVVLVPGFFGFKKMGVGPVHVGRYFRGVEERLKQRGVVVGTAYVGLINGVEDRAANLKREIDRLFPTGKVNLIAHSTGGLDSREMICRLGMADRVASLTTIATPHLGTPVADWVQFAVGPGKPLDKFFKALGINDEVFHNLTTTWCARFNERTPDDPRIRYFSLGGAQRWPLVTPLLIPFALMMKARDAVVAGREIPPVVEAALSHQSWSRDVLAFLRAAQAQVAATGVSQADVDHQNQFEGKNDGVVPLWSTPHGESFEIIPSDHWDQIGWLTIQSHRELYERIVQSLAKKGL